MLSELVEKIMSLAKVQKFEYNGIDYTDKSLNTIVPPSPIAFEIHTLTGICDFFKSNIDGLDLNDILIIVDSYEKVLVKSKIQEPLKKRNNYITSDCIIPSYNFGYFHDVEDFIIKIQAQFESTPERSLLLSVVGNIKEENVQSTGDDGTTQTVIAKKGISIVENVELPNPIKLKPYRTFLEIDQPESEFIFRMQDGPRCALFEADGGMWKKVAMERIHKYLKEKLPKEITIIS